MKLTHKILRSLEIKEKPYKMFDGHGLFILVNPNGRKLWKFRYKINKKEKGFQLGEFPALSLKDARKIRDEYRASLDNGIEPTTARHLLRQANSECDPHCFKLVAQEWFDAKMKGFCERHQQRTRRFIEQELNPYIGNKPISNITTPDLLVVLRRVEKRGTIDTAHRIKGVASKIFCFAIAAGIAEKDPTYALKEALTKHKQEHYAAITEPKEVAKLMQDINNYSGSFTVRNLLRISPLLLARPSEVRELQWTEVDFENARINIPKERMKMRKPHIIPLSTQALEILTEMKNFSQGSVYVFPSLKTLTSPISNNTVRHALRAMGYDKQTMTAHGFRAMARTILDEVLEFPVQHIEHQLAHTVRDALGCAYNRTKHLKQRFKMMQSWSDYLTFLDH